MTWSLRLLFVLSAALLVSGCSSYTVLSPADLEKRGTRTFPGVTREAAVEASAVALASLGYRISQKAGDSGIVKTAPQEVLVTQDTTTTLDRSVVTNRVEGAHSSSTQTRDALAWTLRISAHGDGVTIVAVPRAYRDGNELTEDAFVAEVMDPKFIALWREIEDSLASAPAGPAVK